VSSFNSGFNYFIFRDNLINEALTKHKVIETLENAYIYENHASTENYKGQFFTIEVKTLKSHGPDYSSSLELNFEDEQVNINNHIKAMDAVENLIISRKLHDKFTDAYEIKFPKKNNKSKKENHRDTPQPND
jgi:hypothetical protein